MSGKARQDCIVLMIKSYIWGIFQLCCAVFAVTWKQCESLENAENQV